MSTRTKNSTSPILHADATTTDPKPPKAHAPAMPPTAPASAAATLIAAPPVDANIPAPPKGYDPTDGTNYRGIQPRKAELVALPSALQDLGRFTTYAQVLGTTAPAFTQVQASLTVANEWSTMRNVSTAWDAYCRDQEGMAWVSVHALLDRLRPSFELAASADAALTTEFTGLSSLLAVKKVIANKAASTRRLNRKAVAEGKPPIHGAVGKKRKAAADKAAGAAASAVAAGGAAAPPASTVVTAAAAQPLPVTTPAPAVTLSPPTGAVAVNGASHS